MFERKIPLARSYKTISSQIKKKIEINACDSGGIYNKFLHRLSF